MKVLVSALALAVSMHYATAQWTIQPSVTTADLWQVRFVDRNNGWILGQFNNQSGGIQTYAYRSSILKTINGGNSWGEQILENCHLHGIDFADPSKGWAVGETRGHRGLIYRTTDSGITWNVADSSAEHSYYNTVRFFDSMHGWIGGWNDTAGFVLRTSDGGSNWQTAIDKALDVNDLFFQDTMNGWAVGENGKIYKSTDGGATWTEVYQALDRGVPQTYSPLRRVQFTDSKHGCAIGGLAGIETKVWTLNGGISWNTVDQTTLGSSLHGLWFTDANYGWTVGGVNAGLTVQKTTDGGQSWTKQQFPSVYLITRNVAYFQDVTFVSASEGWIVADAGVILKTTNGGEQSTTFSSDRSDDVVSTFHLDQNYPNPFNPSTTISFHLTGPSFVSLSVYDSFGREVSRLISEGLPAGTHSRFWNASGLPSGVYYYRLQSGLSTETRKLVLIK